MKTTILATLFAMFCAAVAGTYLSFALVPLPESKPPIEGGYQTKMPDVLKGPTVFDARYGCAWSRPGRDPFIGDINSALAALGMPEASRAATRKLIQSHSLADRVRATNGRIQSMRFAELYDTKIAMTFGESTLCYATFPTFSGEQYGDLYIVDGFHIVIWDVCHNVSRLLPYEEAQEYAKSRRPSLIAAVPRTAQPYYPGDESGIYHLPGTGIYGDRGGRNGGGSSLALNTTPEPETWVLFALGGVVLAWAKKWKRKKL